MPNLTSSVRFPGETPAYREARDRLLAAEVDLRKRIEEVAAVRRGLPPGGEVPQDYEFEEDGGRKVRLSQLFAPSKDSLLVYGFMYAPKMEQACPMCTAFLDSLDGAAIHLTQHANLAVVARSPLARIRAFARERQWRNLRLLSSADNSYNRDYHGESADGSQMPSMNVFVRRDGRIRHFYHSEMLFAPSEPGQNARHMDMMWPLWNLLDLTPEGRATDWYPRLDYSQR